jgi:flagellar basal-body rod protein FlgC
MMSGIGTVFDIAGRAMSAQMQRLNTVASNIANADSMAASAETAYRPMRPVFETVYSEAARKDGLASVKVSSITTLDREPTKILQPDHPNADAEGYVYKAAVSTDEEMVEMLEAGRQYQNNLEVVSTLRTLMARTVTMGQ